MPETLYANNSENVNKFNLYKIKFNKINSLRMIKP